MSRIFNRVINQRLANHGLRIVRLEDLHKLRGETLDGILDRLEALESRSAALEALQRAEEGEHAHE